MPLIIIIITDLFRTEHVLPIGVLIAKFYYTGPTGPDQTKSADFVGDPRGPARTRTIRISEKLRWSVRVRAGPVGSGRARVVEFSLYSAGTDCAPTGIASPQPIKS